MGEIINSLLRANKGTVPMRVIFDRYYSYKHNNEQSARVRKTADTKVKLRTVSSCYIFQSDHNYIVNLTTRKHLPLPVYGLVR